VKALPRGPLVAPSLLAAGLGDFENGARAALDAGARVLHLDVMDGSFVPEITFGANAVEALRALAGERGAILDVHLMIESPERHVERFAAAGSDVITVHYEATRHPERLLRTIRELGARAGLAFNPATPVDAVRYLADACDLILIMTVNPGYGGQELLAATLNKLPEVRALAPGALLEVDGGIGSATAAAAARAGADWLVAGSAVYQGNVALNFQVVSAAAAGQKAPQ
jgi:ribulose-phosphate 3-epimerase